MQKCLCLMTRSSAGEQEIERLKQTLQSLKFHPSEPKELYLCRECGQYWEIAYPSAGDVCCAEPEVMRLSERSAAEDYLLQTKS